MSRPGRSPRLCLVVPQFPQRSETFIVNKFAGLLRAGWDVHIVCGAAGRQSFKDFPALRQNEQETRRRVHASWIQRPRALALLLLPVALLRCLLTAPAACLRYLRRGRRLFGIDILRRLYLDMNFILLRPDLIHFEFGALAPGRTYLKELLGCKLVVSFRGYDLNYIGLNDPNYYDEVWKNADQLHFLGRDLLERAHRRGCPVNIPYTIIPPAIDIDLFNPGERVHNEIAGSPERPLRILSVGRLEWKKGYEFGLQAVQKLTHQGVCSEYRIVGDGAYLEPVAFAVHELGLENTAKLLGGIPHAQVKESMTWADVFLHPAVSEGFCNAVIEAQSMMVPVVCSDADGLSENVVDGITGFVAPRRDAEAMAQKLAILAANPGLRQSMGEAGRKRVVENFQLSAQDNTFDHLYKNIQRE